MLFEFYFLFLLNVGYSAFIFEPDREIRLDKVDGRC
jgi:hypothetical protein